MQVIHRWLRNNLGSLLLALLLSLAVWISAVVAADPNEERTLRSVDLEYIGLPTDLVVVNDVPSQIRVTLNAPQSIWEVLAQSPKNIRAWVDLSDLEPGEHTLKISTQSEIVPVRFVALDPGTIKVNLEPLIRRDLPIELVIRGELPVGYRRGEAEITPSSVSITGPQSSIARVTQAKVDLNISGVVDTVDVVAPIQVVDEAGDPIAGIVITPKEAVTYIPISLLGRFKNVAIKVVTTGQVSEGYRLTNISVTPPNVTVFSEDPNLINELPGFVDSMPVSLDNLVDDAVVSVGLNLPEGITSVRDPTVIVQVSVAAIESSLTLSLPLEISGLSPGLQATISPETVDLIVSGPLLVLERLNDENFLMKLDLDGLAEGVYQIKPIASLSPEEVNIQTILPEFIEVIIENASMSVQPSAGTTTDLAPVNTDNATLSPGDLSVTPTP